MITVDTQQVADDISDLLMAVEERGETILICRQGRPVAELRAPKVPVDFPDPLVFHPELKAQINYDPTEPASEDEWPADLR